MSESSTNAAGTGEEPGATGAEPGSAQGQPAGGPRMFSQEEVNNLLAAERKSERAKYAGFKEKAEQYDSMLSERDAAQAELAELKAEEARRALVEGVANAAGVPAEVVGMLNGADAEELAGQVDRIAKLLHAYPPRVDDGGGAHTMKASTAQLFADAVSFL